MSSIRVKPGGGKIKSGDNMKEIYKRLSGHKGIIFNDGKTSICSIGYGLYREIYDASKLPSDVSDIHDGSLILLHDGYNYSKVIDGISRDIRSTVCTKLAMPESLVYYDYDLSHIKSVLNIFKELGISQIDVIYSFGMPLIILGQSSRHDDALTVMGLIAPSIGLL